MAALLVPALRCPQGDLSEAVKVDDCMWNIEGGSVEVSLTKQDGMHWWSCVVKVCGRSMQSW